MPESADLGKPFVRPIEPGDRRPAPRHRPARPRPSSGSAAEDVAPQRFHRMTGNPKTLTPPGGFPVSQRGPLT
jgi:hypothetical protein